MWSVDPPSIKSDKIKKFFWFYDPNIDEMWPVEVWKGRYLDHYTGFWWIIPIDKPPIGVLYKMKRSKNESK